MVINNLNPLSPQTNQTAGPQSGRDIQTTPTPSVVNAADNQKPDRLELSAEAREAYAKASAGEAGQQPSSPSPAGKSSDPAKMTQEQQTVINRLQERDRTVKTHEMQHVAAAGGYTRGGPQYDMQTGPDGKQYAIGGHVNLDMGEVPDNPQATIVKARIIRRAALAPADPSGADRAVASAAAQMEARAENELSEKILANATDRESLAGKSKNSERASQSPQKPAASAPPGTLLNLRM